MSTLSAFMTDDHRACDQKFAEVEELVRAGDWTAARSAWDGFQRDVLCHFAREESLLFPAFENATGSTSGPTAVMRMEHEQMRALFGQLDAAITAEDGERYLGLSDTLMVLLQQHNMKEEQILYPMSEQAVPGIDGVLEQIRAMQPEQG